MRDRMFWVLFRRLWPKWNNVLVIVKPETVVSWHRAGFRLFWRLRSRHKDLGRPKINAEVRTLIRRITEENPTWGAPRIHGELLKLGFEISERTVSRYVHRVSPSDKTRKLWAAFLRNHREVITAMDFFTVPTRTRPTQDPSFQCHGASDRPLDNAAITRSIPGSLSISLCDSGSRCEVRQGRNGSAVTQWH